MNFEDGDDDHDNETALMVTMKKGNHIILLLLYIATQSSLKTTSIPMALSGTHLLEVPTIYPKSRPI